VVQFLPILHSGPRVFSKLTRGPGFADFALRPSGFSEINPWFGIFTVRPEIRKIFTKRSPSLRKIHKNSSKTSKNSFLSNHNSKSSDSCDKILRITSSFFLCVHITHVCCILLIDSMYLLHGRKRCAGTVVRGYSRPSLRGVPAVVVTLSTSIPKA
jgi:hypothetical protein